MRNSRITGIAFTTDNCEVVLDGQGFCMRCTAPGCACVSVYTAVEHIARKWAEAHDEDHDA